MMRADAGLHPNQARRQIGEPRFNLATRPLLPQHDRTAPIVAHDVERVLADIDADHGDCAIGFLRHGVLLVFATPAQLLSLAEAGARPDHPISGCTKRRSQPLSLSDVCFALFTIFVLEKFMGDRPMSFVFAYIHRLIVSDGSEKLVPVPTRTYHRLCLTVSLASKTQNRLLVSRL